MSGMTSQQAKLLQFLKTYEERNGTMPSYDEIAAAMGLRSKSTVAQHIDELVAKGKVRRLPGKKRGIEIVDGESIPIDTATRQALETYCRNMRLKPEFVVSDALREYFGVHPMLKVPS